MADVRSIDHTSGSPAVWPGGLSKQGPHRVGSFALCPQLEAFGHDLSLRPVVQKWATGVGLLGHVGLAYRYGLMLPQRPSWLVYPDAMTAIYECGKDRPDLAVEAARLVSWYYEKYKVNTWTPVAVEEQFEVSFGTEPYTCRTDLLAVEAGEYIVVDHKFVGKISKGYGDSYRADRQMLTNLAILRANGYDIRRVVINAVSREQPFPNFHRFDVPISELSYSTLGRDTAYFLENMTRVRRDYPNPWDRPRNTDACLRKYGLCDYYRLCTDGPRPDVLVEFVQKKGH